MNKKNYSVWILFLVLALASSCKPEPNELELAKFLIDSVQSQTIPDNRVEVFTIKATYSGDSILLKGKTTNVEALEKLKHHLQLQQVKFQDSIIRLPDPALGDTTWGLITLSVANIRYTPAHSAEMATQALMGTPVRILQKENGWYLVQTPDQYIAWTESAGIKQVTQSEMNNWNTSDRLIYLNDNGFVLSSPDQNTLPVSDIVLGSIVTTDHSNREQDDFIGVKLPDGRRGFIGRKDSRNFNDWSSQADADSIAMIKCAFNFNGRPYLWGGTSVKGFDCSGFTKTIYLTEGLILSRDASQQVLQGSEVPKKSGWQNLRAGDLLFFGRTASGELQEKVSHVGMYIGDSRFIHCSGMVRVNSLDSTRNDYKPYYRTNLLHARRIIGSPDMPVSFNSHPWYN